MPFGARRRHDPLGGWRKKLAWLLAALWLSLAGPWARAETGPVVSLERTTDGLFLSARVPLNLPEALMDVMQRGVPLHFVWQTQLHRTRWYWSDQRIQGATRVVRVAYQPLTRRWRVSLSAGPLGDAGLDNALHQNLGTLDEALAAVSRVTRWQVATEAEVAAMAPDKVDVQFRLETGLLPRLFQIGQSPSSDAGITFKESFLVPALKNTEGAGS